MIEFTRLQGETTVIQLTSGEELTLVVKQLTTTRAVLQIEPSDAVKRVLKLDEPAKEKP